MDESDRGQTAGPVKGVPRSEADDGRLAHWRRLYEQLRVLAGACFQGQQDQTLQPTALVHELYLKLEKNVHLRIEDESAFLSLAAQTMRHILVDRARRRNADKRGGGAKLLPLHQVSPGVDDAPPDLIDLDEALRELERLSPRQVRVVELRYFAGLTVAEVAGVLDVSESTVKSDWNMARAWLRRALSAEH